MLQTSYLPWMLCVIGVLLFFRPELTRLCKAIIGGSHKANTGDYNDHAAGVKIVNAPVFLAPTVNIHTNGKQPEARRIGRIMESVTGPTIVGRHDQDNGVIYMNTIHGRLVVRVNEPNATMSDLTNWLDKYGILEPLDENKR